MIESNSFSQEELRQEKIRFWLLWVISNAVGMSIGWCAGEYLGQLALKEFGLTTGIIVAAVVFELALWLTRLFPSEYFFNRRPLKFLDALIWFSTEIGGWIMFSFVESRSDNLTAEVIFIFSLGVIFWIVFAGFGLLRTTAGKISDDWFSKNFVYALFSFFLGVSLVTTVMTTAVSISFSMGKMFNPYVGWGIAGLFLGGFLGAITGFIIIKLIDWDI